jgi:AraC-like DNA-binding protein/mannose-6-phosphate isomerase-like protein (cupin superfamily)
MEYFTNLKNGFPEMLSDNLWAKRGINRRSDELSPLYVSRYSGPHTSETHTQHKFHELLFVVHGEGKFCSRNNQSLALKSGMIILIPAGMEHYELSDRPMNVIWIGVTGKKLESMDDKLFSCMGSKDMAQLFEQIYFESKARKSHAGMLLDSLLALLFAKIFAQGQIGDNAGIEQSIKYLHENFNKPLSISQLAHDLGYSDGYFYRLFKKNCNMTPGEFLNQTRIEHAIEMIRRTSLPFSEIANLCGIKDNLYLSRLIKNATGHSPRALRKLITKN